MCKVLNYDDFITETKVQELIDLYAIRKRDVTFQIEYKGLSFRTKTFRFNIINNSNPEKIRVYENRIRLLDYTVISRMQGSLEDKVRIALAENVKVHCTCPDYLYGGFKYMGTVMDYAIRKEKRKPEVRNPGEKGTTCKHLFFLLSNIEHYEHQMVHSLEIAKHHDYLNHPGTDLID